MKGLVVLVCFLALCVPCYADGIGVDLQSVSVNVAAGRSQGSGVLFIAELGGRQTTWVLTANHVVDGLRSVKDVISDDGVTKKSVTYRDAEVVQERVSNGRGVGEKRFYAKVVSVHKQRDLALLRVRIDGEFHVGAKMYLDESIPEPGTALFHCGAPGGKDIGGTASLTAGIVSRIGALIPDFGGSEHGVFDQVTCSAMGGSSGGLVALQDDGRVVGLITLGLRGSDSFHWMVPSRSILEFLDEIGARWVVDPKAERPESEASLKMPLEVGAPE